MNKIIIMDNSVLSIRENDAVVSMTIERRTPHKKHRPSISAKAGLEREKREYHGKET